MNFLKIMYFVISNCQRIVKNDLLKTSFFWILRRVLFVIKKKNHKVSRTQS